jgi:hypothetical protein
MDDAKKPKTANLLSELSKGLRELVELPAEQKTQPILLPAASSSAKQMGRQEAQPPGTPNAPKAFQQHQDRPKTQKEHELDELIAKRQSIIESLKAKNPLVLESRRKIAEIIPAIRGKGASQAIHLMEEAEKIEFSIATEAYTPKKEKDLLKHLRQIKIELSKHKELEAAQKKVDAARKALHSLMSEIRSLEHELASCRAACEAKYGEILAERKSAYESRVKRREEHAHKREQDQHRRYEELQTRVRQERKKEYDDEIGKYMKKHDDTVSLEEIVKIEKKDKKEEKKSD